MERQKIRFTEEEKTNLINDYKNGLDRKELASKYKILEASIRRILRKAGEYNHEIIPVSEENQQIIIKEYKNGKSSEKLAEELNIVGSTVCRILKRNGIELRDRAHQNRTYNIDENYFEKIDNEYKAYFLGFLYADGSLSSTSHNIKLTLHEKDRDILEKFSHAIYGDEKISTETRVLNNGNVVNYLSVNIYSKKMHEDLVKLGCTPIKSFTITFPKLKDLHLTRHFIRGFLDGDGCICNSNPDRPRISVTSNKIFLEGLNEFIEKNLSISFGKLQKKIDCENDTRSFEMTAKDDVINLLNYLYNGSTISMDRKNESKKISLQNYEYKINKKTSIFNYNSSFIYRYNGKLLDKEYLSKLTDEEKPKIVNEVFNFYRENGFPYPTSTDDELIKDFHSLQNFNVEKIHETDNILTINAQNGYNIFKHFAPHYFEATDKSRKSIIDCFNDDELFKKVILNRIDQKESLSSNMLRIGFANSRIAFRASVFNIILAKYIYTKFTSNGSIVYDYSMGYGQRLLAALSLKHDVTYIATDPYEKTYNSNLNIYNFYKDKSFLSNKKVDLNNLGSENFYKPEYEGKVDLAFSSPPYFNLERYCKESTQAYYSNNYDDFINNYWGKSAENIDKMLKPNGTFIINVKENVNGFNLANDMVNIFLKKGYIKEAEYKILLSKNLNYQNKDENKFEPIYVLKKP